MPFHGFLCSRCGSPRHEIVATHELRCSDCGLGVSVSSPVASARGTATDEQRVERERWHGEQVQRDFARIARADFSVYGLDNRWTGLRWLGGCGDSNGVVTHIQLAHSDTIGDVAASQIRVDTRAPDPVAGADVVWYQMAQHNVQEVWRRTGSLSEDVRQAAFPAAPASGDPTAPWREAVIRVDDQSVAFRMLGDAEYLVAQARRGDLVVGIEAVARPIEHIGLVTIRDFTEYEAGSHEIAQRWK